VSVFTVDDNASANVSASVLATGSPLRAGIKVPTTVVASAVAGGLHVAWTVSGQTGVKYHADASLSSGGAPVGSCTPTVTGLCDIAGLPAAPYYVSVFAVDDGDSTNMSASVLATGSPLRAGIDVPTAVHGALVAGGVRVTFVVSGQVGVTYHAEARAHVGGALAGSCTLPAASPCDITGLPSGTYDVRVWAVDDGASGNVSAYVDAPENPVVAGVVAPTGVSAAAIVGGVRVTFSASSQTSVVYHAEARVGSTVAGFCAVVVVSPCDITGLLPGKYNVRVYASDISDPTHVSAACDLDGVGSDRGEVPRGRVAELRWRSCPVVYADGHWSV
jgi:hypothetical protein